MPTPESSQQAASPPRMAARPAPEARLLYVETADSLARRSAQVELKKLAPAPGADLRGRPTKRAGRMIRRFSEG